MGNGGSAGKVAAAGGHGLALEEAVEGVGGVGLDGVGEVAEAIGENGGAICAHPACVVQSRLQGLVARVTPYHAPICTFLVLTRPQYY